MEIKRVETLGDVVAFKPNEIQVVGNVYDRVPAEFFDSFVTVCNNAKLAYDAKVDAAKKAGNKPKSAQYKKEAIAENITPFLSQRCGVTDARAGVTIRTTRPRIPGDNEQVVVNHRVSLVQDVDVALDDVSDLFGDFDADTYEPNRISYDQVEGGLVIDGSGVSMTLPESIDLGEDLFEGDAFDWSSLI